MSQYAFGSGSMWGFSTSAANATPARFGAFQEGSIDFNATVKELFGQYQLPLSVARGTVKVQGKAKFAQLQGRILNDLFFGATMASGQVVLNDHEPHSIPAATPFTVTVNNSAQFGTDLGVSYAATGLPLVKVASSPTAGQYSEAAGVYTFAAADTGLSVNIDYTSTQTTPTGDTITMTNQLLGVTPNFQAVMSQEYNQQRVTWTLFQCVSSKFTFQTKLEDFTVPEFDFSAFVNGANQLGTISLAEAS